MRKNGPEQAGPVPFLTDRHIRTEASDRRVAEVTTHSPEAYRYYLEGVEYAEMQYNSEAIEAFEKALEYDSTFAMVHFHLAYVKDAKYLASALRYSDNITTKKRGRRSRPLSHVVS